MPLDFGLSFRDEVTGEFSASGVEGSLVGLGVDVTAKWTTFIIHKRQKQVSSSFPSQSSVMMDPGDDLAT